MNLSHLRYFLAVAETGSITRGAERAFVAQPTLSAAIAKLEAELGVSLLTRRGRQVELTSDGARFRRHAADILRQVAEARRSMRGRRTQTRFSLGLVDGVPFPAVGRLLSDFGRSTPGVELEIYQGSAAEVERRLSQSRLSAAIMPATSAAAGAHTLFRDQVVLAVPNDNALTRKPKLALDDLHHAPLIVWTGLDGLPGIRRRLASQGVQPSVVLRTPHVADALSAVSNGLGLCLVPDSFAVEAADRLPLDGIDVQRAIVLALAPDTSPALNDFVAFATSHNWRGAFRSDRLDIAH